VVSRSFQGVVLLVAGCIGVLLALYLLAPLGGEESPVWSLGKTL